jgi:hypothetical protein
MAFAPSDWLVRDLTAVVEISALPMLNARQDLTLGGSIGSEFIRYDNSWYITEALQQLAKEALRCLLATAALNQNVEHVPVLINGSPEIVQLASDPDEHDLCQLDSTNGAPCIKPSSGETV